MPIYSYQCQCGNEFDELVKLADRQHQPCPKCAASANQILTPVRIDYYHMGTDPAFETASSKWESMHKKQAVKESQTLHEHGDYGSAPGA